MFYHDPVMAKEIAEYLLWNPQGKIVDCTLGGGGHSEYFLKQNDQIRVVGLDRDPVAIAHAQNRLKEYDRFSCVHTVFSQIAQAVEAKSATGILCDLGISSRQVDDESRGFSFRGDAAVDLRMNSQEGMGASDWIRNTSDDDIAQAMRFNSDLEKAYKIAQELKKRAAEREILSEDIRQIVATLFPHKFKDQHSLCARILQAIRMEVNDELGEIKTIIQSFPQMLTSGGVVAFLTYHSVEDRLVKHAMAEYEKECVCPPQLPLCVCGGNNALFEKLTRKPLPPTSQEIAKNPRARSAKLRVWRLKK